MWYIQLSAFVALSVASLVWALIAGEDGERLCSRVWVEAVVGGALLVLGTVLMVNSLSWPAAVKLRAANDHRTALGLERFMARATLAITLMSIVMLAYMTHDYISTTYRGRAVPAWIEILADSYFALFLVSVLVAAWARNRRRWPGNGRMLVVATYLTSAYAVCGAALVGFTASSPMAYWNSLPNLLSLTTLTMVVLPVAPITLATIWVISPSGLAVAPTSPVPRQQLQSAPGR